MKRTVWKVSGLTILCVLSYFFSGCPCSDYVKMVVLVGHRTADDCRKATDTRSSNDLTFICPGEEVTICWQANCNVKIDPGIGTFGTIGLTYLTPKSSTTITASVPGTCASSVSVTVNVVDHDTPSTWDAGWDLRCTQITFDVDPLFVSPKVFAKDITALWSPIITDPASGTTVACSTPPFLDGFQVEDVFGFKIDNPNITVPFSRHIPAVEHWKFAFKASCPVDFTCNTGASLPFDLTLTCLP